MELSAVAVMNNPSKVCAGYVELAVTSACVVRVIIKENTRAATLL